MTPQERLANYPRHPSIRGEFGFELYKHMVNNKNIFLLMGDLGYKLFDSHREDFPDRALNLGASEGSMVGIAVGLAQEGKIAVCYTISSFYLRAAETIALYLHGEQTPVKLVGSGRDDDYKHDGPSHHGGLSQAFLSDGPHGILNIKNFYPQEMEDVPSTTEVMLYSSKPCFMSLKK